MTLIALLIGLIIERLATQLFHWRRMRWLDRIIDKGFTFGERFANWPALIPVLLLSLLLVLPVAAVTIGLVDRLFGFPHLLLAVVVLFFSLGPNDIGEDVNEYCEALQDGDEERINQTARALIEGDVPDDALERIHCVEAAVCVQANNRLFAVIFWFVLLGPLGPLGAWAYRVTDLVRRRAVFNAAREDEGGTSERLRDAAVMLHGWLAWIPARLTAIGYAVAGHFDAALAAWRTPGDKAPETPSEGSEALLARVGVGALALDDADSEIAERGVRGATAANRLVFRLPADLGGRDRRNDLIRLDRVRAGGPALLIAILTTLPACSREDVPIQRHDTYSRIVTLAPNLTELVFSAGAGESLVGVSAYSDYPPQVQSLPRVGDAFTVDLEQLALLSPDLLLAWESGTPAHVVDELEHMGYHVETIRTRGLADIPIAITRIGNLAGTRAIAETAAAEFTTELDTLAVEHAETESITVFYQVSLRPLYTVSGGHYASEIVELCGGRNIFAELGELAPTVDAEAVVDRNPEVILASSEAGEDAFAAWSRWPAMAANRLGNYYHVPADEISRPTTRVIVAAQAVCEALRTARQRRADYEGANGD